MTMRFVAPALAVALLAGPVLAEECPDAIPEDSDARRALAKEWFTKGDESINRGDDLAALKAFQCSLKFVPHGFTAFNIAQIAERVGDLELAVSSYNQYLLLVPDAKDAGEISQKVEILKQRLARAKQQARSVRPVKPAGPRPVEPPPVAGGQEGTDRSEQATEAVSEKRPSGINYRTWAWVSYGGAAAFVLGGVITNLLARSKMDTCRSTYDPNDLSTKSPAESACSDATALAYTSYVFFGIGGAAAALGTFFILRPTESSEVAMTPLPEGGLALRWGGSF
jgi:tetratricopeptide (TPR) repeat protein